MWSAYHPGVHYTGDPLYSIIGCESYKIQGNWYLAIFYLGNASGLGELPKTNLCAGSKSHTCRTQSSCCRQ